MGMVTISSRLCASEETRRYFWELMQGKNTLLVNELSQQVNQHHQFEDWLQKGSVPEKALKQLCTTLKTDSRFEDQPARFYTSAYLTVSDIYKSWIALQKKRQRKLDGKKRWLEVIESDFELAKTNDFSQELISAKAHEILAQVLSHDVVNKPQKTKDKKGNKQQKSQVSKINRTRVGILLEAYDATEDILSRRAIIHLLRNDFQVNEQEDSEKLALRLEKKRIQIKRLEEQLKSQLPKGRDPTGEEMLKNLEEAVSLPKHIGLTEQLLRSWAFLAGASLPSRYIQFDAYLLQIIQAEDEKIKQRIEPEFLAWEREASTREANLLKLPTSLPYPIIFGSSDDLIWSLDRKEGKEGTVVPGSAAQTSSNGNLREPHKNKKRRRKKTVKQERICVKFKGKELKNHIFRVQCDRRQLHIFQQFLEDWQTHQQLDEEDKFSMGLFLLRSACLFWREDKGAEKSRKRKGKRANNNQSSESSTAKSAQVEEKPWNTHRLYLHCTIDTRLLSAQGTEEIGQEKRASTVKKLDALKEKRELSKEQKVAVNRYQSTLNRLDNPSPSRLSKPQYESQSRIRIGVSFSCPKLVAVAVMDMETGKALKYYSVRQLLTDNTVREPRHNRSILQLRLEKYRLVNRLRQQKQQNSRQQKQQNSRQQKQQNLPQKKQQNLPQKKQQNSRQQKQQNSRQQKQQNSRQRDKKQKQEMYVKQNSASNLGQYLDRLLAARIVELALEWKASTIVLPELGDIRESLESEIQARAKRKFAKNKIARKKYAKRFRARFHSWSYSRLRQSIQSRAAREEIALVVEKQAIRGTLPEKARDLVLSSYHIR